jgi:hypothetical protein
LPARDLEQLKEAEHSLYAAHGRFGWTEDAAGDACSAAGLRLTECRRIVLDQPRIIRARDLAGWLATDTPGGYGATVAAATGKAAFKRIAEVFRRSLENTEVPWRTTLLLIDAVPETS